MSSTAQRTGHLIELGDPLFPDASANATDEDLRVVDTELPTDPRPSLLVEAKTFQIYPVPHDQPFSFGYDSLKGTAVLGILKELQIRKLGS
jgi:hypothetical protein